MKKILILKLLLLTILTYSQDMQNSNWVFSGSGGFNFNSLGLTPIQFPTNIQPSSLPGNQNPTYTEGCATVSDHNGNLLMFSDGVRLWCYKPVDNTFVLVTNQLKGNNSSAQNVVFVPKPSYPNRYYVFTINGETSNLLAEPGIRKGLYYSEIDISSQTMIFTNAVLSFSEPLIIGSNVKIDQNFENKSEAITSTKHGNGKDYWFVAHVKNDEKSYLLSYQVTCTGIINNSTSIVHPVNSSSLMALTAKISGKTAVPNTNKIALAMTNDLFCGDFNNLTGQVSLNNITSFSHSDSQTPFFYGLEFSSNSNFLYYSFEGLSRNRITGAYFPRSKIGKRNLTTNLSQVRELNTDFFVGLQRAINDRIYITQYTAPFLGGQSAVINNPNSTIDFVFTYTGTSVSTGMPQLVHFHQPTSGMLVKNDVFNFNSCVTSTSVNSVLQANPNYPDTFNGNPITSLLNYSLNVVGVASPIPLSGGVYLNPSNGKITVLNGTPTGVYVIRYKLCAINSCSDCSNDAIVTINVVNSEVVMPIFNLPFNSICYEGEVPDLPNVSDNGIIGTWSPSVVNNTESGTYVFTPSAEQCANSYSFSFIVLPTYDLTILDQYVDGTQSGNNIVGLYVNGNFPLGTTYEWNVYREDGSIDNYSASSQTLRYVAASFENRITYVEVIAYYGNCSRLFTSAFHCAIPNSDQYGNVFPDCSSYKLINKKENILNNGLIRIYPNPISSMINFEGLNDVNCAISIYDSFGKLVLRNEKINEKLDFSNYNKGFYFYEISKDNLILLRGKLIKN